MAGVLFNEAITTAKLAEIYGTEPLNITNNFKRNEFRFTDGIHYLKLDGDTLRDFKKSVIKSNGSTKHQNDVSSKNEEMITNRVNSFYLWSERGASYSCLSCFITQIIFRTYFIYG